MKVYSGAVFFIDILGIGQLTRKNVALSDADYDAWGCSSVKNEHAFSAKVLMAFRRVLNSIRKNRDVDVAQLSDSAFIWARDPMAVINAARDCMWQMIRAGLLARGGLAFGEIVEPDTVNRKLGQFIMGEAVTKAADLEGTGKGCRVFAEPDIAATMPRNIHIANKEAAFAEIKNPLDYSVKDEFRWYLFPDDISQEAQQTRDPLRIATCLMELVARLRFCPLFGWNVENDLGKRQVAASIETISSCTGIYLAGLDYRFTAESLLPKGLGNRSDRVLRKYLSRYREEIAEEMSRAPRRARQRKLRQ